MNESEYPHFLRDLLQSCPAAGSGVHGWLFKVARYLHRYHGPEEICAILRAGVTACGRELQPHEIPDAVRNSGAYKWHPNALSASQRRAQWLAAPSAKRVPEFDPELAVRAAARVPVLITPEWLKLHSPDPVCCAATAFLRALFAPGEQVLIFSRYQSQGMRWPGELTSLARFRQIHWPEGAWFLCNPVDGQYHWNPRMLKESRRSEESVTSFRYAVLESDREPKEQWSPIWLKILAGLSLPIVSITDSAGKSVHALIRVNAASKADWDQYKRLKLRPLVALGADDGALSAVRLSRLPDCWRGDRHQELLYLNPKANGTPIYESTHQSNY